MARKGKKTEVQIPAEGNGAAGARTPPAHECRIGRLKVTVWANHSEKEGVWYSVNLTRSYRDGEGNWKQATSLGRDDLLPAGELLRLAYLWIAQQKGTNLGGPVTGDTATPPPPSDVPI